MLVAALAVGGWLLVRSGSGPQASSAAPAPRPAEAARTLQQLQEGLAAGDRVAVEALAADAPTGARLAAAASNADRARVRGLVLRYVAETGTVAADGSWTATVSLRWRFAGFDDRAAVVEIEAGFRPRGDRVVLTRLGGGAGRTPLWLTGPLQVERDARTLVLVAGSQRDAQGYADRARAAVPVVRRVLTRWRPRLVVEVPASTAALERTLGARAGAYDDIAAVAATVDGSSDPTVPVHVYVNPAVLGRLGVLGAQVVISHEATHVATDAPATAMPSWLLEGFADYVALRDVDLPLSTTAGQVLDRVRNDGAPRELPTASDLAHGGAHLGAAYEAAWLANRVLARRGGEERLVALYERVRGGASLDRELRRLFGLDVDGLTRLWRTRLSHWAA